VIKTRVDAQESFGDHAGMLDFMDLHPYHSRSFNVTSRPWNDKGFREILETVASDGATAEKRGDAWPSW
jgi:hypothetical protein